MKYEYKEDVWDLYQDRESLEGYMNNLGKKGWEIIKMDEKLSSDIEFSIKTRFILKRPVYEPKPYTGPG